MFVEKRPKHRKRIDFSFMKNEGIPVSSEGQTSNKERTFPSAFYRRNKRARAGMTIEAALVLPLFLFFVIAFSYFLIILSLQSDIQLRMEEAAREIGKLAYFAEHTDRSLQTEEAKGDEQGVMSAGINSLSIKALVLKEGLGEEIERSRIKGGTGGFYIYHSSYDMKSGILDIIANYTYDIPFLPDSIGDIRFVQRARSHVWTGKELKDTAGFEKDEQTEGKTVYVTPYGTVYHLSTECHYLDLSISAVSGEEVAGLRNKDGGKYYMCTDCCKKGETYAEVYITDYGTNWHSDIHCTGLKRTIEEIDISEVGNMHACPKCGKEH